MKHLRLITAASIILFGFSAFGPNAQAQGFPRIPKPDEIRKMIEEELEKLPDQTVEFEGIVITYKAVPTNPADLMKGLPIPPGFDPQIIIKQFSYIIYPTINDVMSKIGTAKVKGTTTYKKKTLPKGEFVFGIPMSGMAPKGFFFRDKDGTKKKNRLLKRPMKGSFKASKAKSTASTLTLRFVKDKKKPDRVYLIAGWGNKEYKSSKYFQFTK